MSQIVFRFETLKKRFSELNQDVLDSFLYQHQYLSLAFNEALENFLLANKLEKKESAMPMIKATEAPLQIKPENKPLAALPNAKQQIEYVASTADYGLVVAVTFSEECGLNWESETQQIQGIPSIGGKEISVQFQFADGSKNTAMLYINADPRSLWNNIPSQTLITEHWKADSASEKAVTPFGNIIAARMRGRTHAHKGTCCDDDFTFGFHEPTGIHFLAVADGAGSAEYSRLGSKLAVEKAKENFFDNLNNVSNNLKELPNQDDHSEKLMNVANGLLYHAALSSYQAQLSVVNETITEKSLSCTLLLIFSLPLKSGKWFTAAYWVGDGAVAVFNPYRGDVHLLGESDGGQYSGETQFLSKAEFENDLWRSRVKTSLSEQAPVLFAMTDGVSDPKFKSDAALRDPVAWKNLWAELREPLSQSEPEKALEQWLDFWSVGEHDDRTLAMFIPYFAENNEEVTACTEATSDKNLQQASENSEENAKLPNVTLQKSEVGNE